MSQYAEDILDVAEEIRENGERVTFLLSEGIVTDPNKPWKETQGAELEWEDIYLLYDIDRSLPFLAYMGNTDIPKGGSLAYLAATVPFTPTQEHVVNSPSRGKLKIDGIDIVAPGSETILYILRLSQ